jgi:hypothetical protein
MIRFRGGSTKRLGGHPATAGGEKPSFNPREGWSLKSKVPVIPTRSGSASGTRTDRIELFLSIREGKNQSKNPNPPRSQKPTALGPSSGEGGYKTTTRVKIGNHGNGVLLLRRWRGVSGAQLDREGLREKEGFGVTGSTTTGIRINGPDITSI